MNENLFYKPVVVLKDSPFAFTIALEVAISTYDNFLCVVYQNDNAGGVELIKLCKEATTGYEVGITAVDSTTILVTIPESATSEAVEAFYNIEFACMDSGEKKVNFLVEKLFEIKASKI